MAARLSIHVPEQAAHVHVLEGDGPLLLGRDAECAIRVDHHSVSRRHLHLLRDGDGHWAIEDLGSKNGTRVDGHVLRGRRALGSGHWFAAGDVYAQFELTDASREEALHSSAERRRHSSMMWSARLRHGEAAQGLISDLLRGIVDIAEARRAFLLSAGHDGRLRVRACHGIETHTLASPAFSGSRSAVERALELRRPVFLSDQRDQAWLQGKASVLASGIRALVALPLLRDDRVLGVVYADTDAAERVYTDLDAQLLEALVSHAGNVMSALELEADLAEMAALLEVGADGIGTETGPAPAWLRVAGAASTEAR